RRILRGSAYPSDDDNAKSRWPSVNDLTSAIVLRKAITGLSIPHSLVRRSAREGLDRGLPPIKNDRGVIMKYMLIMRAAGSRADAALQSADSLGPIDTMGVFC